MRRQGLCSLPRQFVSLQESIPSAAFASACLHVPTACLQAFFSSKALSLSNYQMSTWSSASGSVISSTHLHWSSMDSFLSRHFPKLVLKSSATLKQASNSANFVAFPVTAFPHFSSMSFSHFLNVSIVLFAVVPFLNVAFADDDPLESFIGVPSHFGLSMSPPSAVTRRSIVALKSPFFFPFEPWILSLPFTRFTCRNIEVALPSKILAYLMAFMAQEVAFPVI